MDLADIADAYDVIVLGSGVGGLSAALAARASGLSPLLIEKAEKLGGTTTSSYGFLWAGNNHLLRATGAVDDRDDIIRYLRWVGGGEIVEERMLALVDHSPAALEFFEACGLRFQLCRGISDHYFGAAPGARKEGRSLEVQLISGDTLGPWRDKMLVPADTPTCATAAEQFAWGGVSRYPSWDKEIVRERQEKHVWGKGLGLACHLVKGLLDRDVPIVTGERIDGLTVEGERVTGIRLADGRAIAARKGVVIATGGYEWNPELMADFDALPFYRPQSPPSSTGDGLILAAEHGAAIRRIQNNLSWMLGFALTPDEPGARPIECTAGIVELCSPHTLVVNRGGIRFADESFFQSIVPRLHDFDPASHEHPNLPCYLIFDEQFVATYSYGLRPAGTPLPRSVPRAGTLAELAQKLGIAGDGLAQTVARFNDFARTGTDRDYRRGEFLWSPAKGMKSAGANHSLGTVETPPFYGIELRPSLGSSSAGLMTNAHAQVLHQRRRPIPGLYATGIAAARTELGTGYQAGLNLVSGMTFGYLAARHMKAQN